MRKIKLRDVADIQTGPFGSQLHKEDYVKVGTPIVTVEHLGNRLFTQQNLPRVSEFDTKRLQKYLLEEGDIVFSRVGSVDRCSFVDMDHAGWLFSGRCLRIRPSLSIEPLYLYYFLCLESTKKFIRSIAVGATMPSINTKILGEIEIPIPSLDIQKKISYQLSIIDSKIETNNRINDNLEAQALALFNELYSKSNQEVLYIDQIQILGGGTPKTGESSFWNGEIPFFTPKDAKFSYTICTEKKLTTEGLSHCNSQLYPKNTVFVTARGTVGKVSMAGVPMAMNQSCYALIGKCIPQLLVYFYTQKIIRNLKNKANGAVFDAITTRDFEYETVMKFSDDLLNKFNAKVEPIYNLILNNHLENQQLTSLRNSLLNQLMSNGAERLV